MSTQIIRKEILPGHGLCICTGINVLCGVGILSMPYAVKEGGWAGLSILLAFAAITWYTGVLLGYCLESAPGLQTYPDIGQAAFGTTGRFIVSVSPHLIFTLCKQCLLFIYINHST